jgi:hypothetical protein
MSVVRRVEPTDTNPNIASQGKLSCATYCTNTYFELQPRIPYNTSFSCCHHHASMLPPRSTAAAITATALPPLPPCCHAAAATLPPLLCCCRYHAATVLPPRRRHCHWHHAAATTAGVAKLPLPPPSCHRCRYLHCKIGLITKKNSVRWQTLISFNFLDYSDLASNSCMGRCFQYSTP